VRGWLGKVGFAECQKIVFYQKITGAKLASSGYDFMRDVLGITDENQCAKLKGEIDKVRSSCIEDGGLYGWGNNKHGQLGVLTPEKIRSSIGRISQLPGHVVVDETHKDINSIKGQQSILIEKIFCGNRFSAILLTNGELWVCGNCAQAGKSAIQGTANAAQARNDEEEEKLAQMQRDDEFKRVLALQKNKESSEEEWGGGRNKKKKKSRQKSPPKAKAAEAKSKKRQRFESKQEEQKQLKEMRAELAHSFVDLTGLFSMRAIGKNMIVDNVWWTPTHMVARCQHNFKVLENPMARNKFVKGVNKFRGADIMIDKVAYYARQPENRDKVFTVHHEDRFLGLIETNVLTFIEESETPLHRIQLFKCDGLIIWDRKNKFTLI